MYHNKLLISNLTKRNFKNCWNKWNSGLNYFKIYRDLSILVSAAYICKSQLKLVFFRWKRNSVARNIAQFREKLIASLLAIIAQMRAMKWRKRKQPQREIPRNGIPTGNLNFQWSIVKREVCPIHYGIYIVFNSF